MLDGFKTYIFAAVMLALAGLKMFTDIPEIESISMLGVSEADDLLSTALLLFTGRSALKKFN